MLSTVLRYDWSCSKYLSIIVFVESWTQTQNSNEFSTYAIFCWYEFWIEIGRFWFTFNCIYNYANHLIINRFERCDVICIGHSKYGFGSTTSHANDNVIDCYCNRDNSGRSRQLFAQIFPNTVSSFTFASYAYMHKNVIFQN